MNQIPTGNSTYPKGGVSCYKDSFVVNQTLVFQIKFCGEKARPSQICKPLADILTTKQQEKSMAIL